MDQIKTGRLIRTLRLSRGMTQSALAQELGISDKTVSKWECGAGAPDISLIPGLSKALGVDTGALLRGELGENVKSSGDMKRLSAYVCPDCGNVIFSTDAAMISCCGKNLAPLEVQTASPGHELKAELSDGEWFVTAEHPMEKGHHIAFIALLSGDTLIVRRLYPQWGAQTRLPFFPSGTLLWYCTEHGLFSRPITVKKGERGR